MTFHHRRQCSHTGGKKQEEREKQKLRERGANSAAHSQKGHHAPQMIPARMGSARRGAADPLPGCTWSEICFLLLRVKFIFMHQNKWLHFLKNLVCWENVALSVPRAICKSRGRCVVRSQP